MNKKSQPMKQGSEMDHNLSIAEADYRMGNFYEARKLAKRVMNSKDSVADSFKKAQSILRKTSIDPAVWAVGLASLVFIAVVALVFKY